MSTILKHPQRKSQLGRTWRRLKNKIFIIPYKEGRGVLPDQPKEAEKIKRKSSRYLLKEGVLYKKGIDNVP